MNKNTMLIAHENGPPSLEYGKKTPIRGYVSTKLLFLFIGILVIIVSSASYGNEGVFLLGNDALQLGRASSGVASPRSSYWCYMNPASMVDLEKRIDVNMYTVFADITLKPRGIIGNRLDGDLDSNGIYCIASGGMTWPFENKEWGVLGGGLYIPSGTGVEYPNSRNILSRVFGNHDRRLDYQHFRLVLAYAREIYGGWSLGVGLHPSVSRFRSDHITLRLHTARANYEWDEALGIGFGIGVYKAWERFAVGATYTSRHWTERMDKYRDLLAYSLDTPHIVQWGAAFKLTPKIEFTGDIKYLNWKDVETYGKKMYQGGFNWSDQWGYKLGAEWQAHKRLTLMAGFAHSSTPIDKDHAFLSGLVPVTVEDHVTAGLTYKINDHHDVHFVWVHGIRNTVRDSGRGRADIFSWLGRGSKVSSNGESVVIGYSYKF